jgi:hypothetical protein
MPLIRGLCHTADFNQMWSKHVPLNRGLHFAMEFDHVWINNVLEECDPIVLVLILILVSVGRLPPELVVVKINFTSFLTIYSSFTKLSYS